MDKKRLIIGIAIPLLLVGAIIVMVKLENNNIFVGNQDFFSSSDKY
jgi:hypothetical protein